MTEQQTNDSTAGIRYLPITVRNRIASYAAKENLVCCNSDYRLRFTFDEEWNLYPAKTAQIRFFTPEDGWCKYEVVFEGTECTIPVITRTDAILVGVYAGNLRTTTEAEIPCLLSALSAEGTPADPPEDVYHQLMEKLQEIASLNEETAKELVENALSEAAEEGKIGGKSAYQHALEGGYIGSEEEFNLKLATEMQIAGTDTTMSVPGMAADAAAAGEKFRALRMEKIPYTTRQKSGSVIRILPGSAGTADIIGEGTFLYHGNKNLLDPTAVASTEEGVRTFGRFVPMQTADITALYPEPGKEMDVSLPAGTYTFTLASDNLPFFADTKLEYIKGGTTFTMANGETKTFDEAVRFTRILYSQPISFAAGTVYTYKAQLEYGSECTAYEVPAVKPTRYESGSASIPLADGTNILISDGNMTAEYLAAFTIDDGEPCNDTSWSSSYTAEQITALGDERYLPVETGKNLFNKEAAALGKCLTGGLETDSDEMFVSDYIPININGRSIYTLSGADLSSVFLWYYRERKQYCRHLPMASDNEGIFMAPKAAKYLRICAPIRCLDTLQFELGGEATAYEPYTKNKSLAKINTILHAPTPFRTVSEEMSSDMPLVMDVPCANYDNVIGFDADVNYLDNLTISLGRTDGTDMEYVVIDGENIAAYHRVGEEVTTLMAPAPHGLTLDTGETGGANGHISVSIVVKTAEKASFVNLTMNGKSVTLGEFPWSVRGCMLTASVGEESYLLKPSLTYGCNSAGNDVWMFGDSFSEHWPDELFDMGYTRWMVDVCPNRNSIEAFDSFKRCLKYHTPKTVIWCLGMDENTDGYEEYVYEEWIPIAYRLISECERMNIELIFCTIPNTPLQNNDQKNDFIRWESCCRYVDFANATGSSSDGWYDGLLSEDNLHPEQGHGTRCLSHVMTASVPELCKRNWFI